MSKMEFAKVVSNMSYRDLIDIAEKISNQYLDDSDDIARALLEVSTEIIRESSEPLADRLISRLSSYSSIK